MSVVETASVMMVMEVTAVIYPIPISPAVPRMPPVGIITPIPGRAPAYPIGTPKPIVDDRPVDIHRLNHVIITIDILIADNLYRHIVRLVFLDVYRRYILIDIFRQHSL